MSTVAEIVFWGSLALLAYPYVGYPLLVAALSLLFPRPKSDPAYRPRVSVLIAAYNEQASIEKKIRQTLACDYPPDRLEVIVVSDGSTDSTDQIVRALAAEDPRLRFYRRERGGKTSAQNFGVTQCSGDIVVFSDATSDYAPDAIRQLVALFADTRVGAVGGFCRFFDPDKGHSPSGLGQALYGSYEQAIRTFQSRIRTATACSGAIYAVRRELYVPLAPHACSDMAEPLEIVRRGYRVVYAPRALAWEVAARTVGQEFHMRVRVTTQGLQGLLEARDLLYPWRHPWISFQLLSHKFLRYLLPVPLVVLFLSNALLMVSRAQMLYLFLAQAAFYALALISTRVPLPRGGKLLGLPLYFCTLNAAILASFVEVLRGNKFAVWETVRK